MPVIESKDNQQQSMQATVVLFLKSTVKIFDLRAGVGLIPSASPFIQVSRTTGYEPPKACTQIHSHLDSLYSFNYRSSLTVNNIIHHADPSHIIIRG
jgi:hypothetical protein